MRKCPSRHLALRKASLMAETGAREGTPVMGPKKRARLKASRDSVGVSGITG